MIELFFILPDRTDGTPIDASEVSHWEWEYKNSYTTYDIPPFFGMDNQRFGLEPGVVCWRARPIMIDGNNGEWPEKFTCLFEID